MSDPTPAQPNNPFHGITLEKIVSDLSGHYGWEYLGQRIPIRCFLFDPSVKSSLKFLRKTPWARTKVENLYWRYLTDTSRETPQLDATPQKPEPPREERD